MGYLNDKERIIVNSNKDEIKIEEPQSDQSPEKPESVQTPEDVKAELPKETHKKAVSQILDKPEASKTKKFFQKVLMWLIVIVVAFGAGFLLDHFLRYQPMADNLQQTQAELAELQTDLDSAENQVERMTPKLEAANAKITSLEDDLEMANARVQLNKMLVAVSNARLSLFLEDFEDVQAALDETQTGLEALGPMIEQVDEELALSMSRRLDLIIDGLERDPETAAVDLDLFMKDLLALEPLLFEVE